MRRLHLFEFEDLPWLPRVIREGVQDFLGVSHGVMRFYEAWTHKLADVLRRTGERRVIDLCSGAAGPLPYVVEELRHWHGLDVSAVMTDLYPNRRAVDRVRQMGDPALTYLERPVNAGDVPRELQGVRTMFTGFHHLRPEVAESVLGDAFRRRQAICVFEYTRCSPMGFLSSVTYPFVVWALMPRVRPVSWQQLALTYLVPLLPAVITWDGIVSNARTYSPAQLRAMTADFTSRDYAWEIGMLRKRGYPVGLTFLLGLPTPDK